MAYGKGSGANSYRDIDCENIRNEHTKWQNAQHTIWTNVSLN